MKKLFYRLSNSQSFARLLTISVFAALGLYHPSVAFAIYCQAPGGTCSYRSGFSCPLGTTKCSLTSTGSTSGTGSEWSATILLGDEDVSVEPSSACGGTFFDTTAATVGSQVTDCKFTPDPTLEIPFPEEQDALCSFSNLRCSCFSPGTCDAKANKPGTRTSTMTCPTLSPTGQNLAGCTGTLTISALDGTPLETVNIGDGLTALDSNNECGLAFPAGNGFKRFVIGSVTQSCQSGSIPSEELVKKVAVRGPAVNGVTSYSSSTVWAQEFAATCNPEDGFPSNSCNNDGGAWITFSTTQAQCVASTFSCGQLASGTSGPAPKKCDYDALSGQCSCRCPRCTPEGTLVNLGGGDSGKFVVANSNSAFACEVTVTGN